MASSQAGKGQRRARKAVVLGALAGVAALAWLAWSFFVPGPVRLGQASYDNKDYQQAATQAVAALKQSPQDPEAMKLLARASGRLGNLEASRSIYNRMGTESLEAEDLYVLGSILKRDGMHAESQELFLMGHERDPDHEETMAELGRLYMGTDRLVEALEMARRLTARDGWQVRGQTLEGLLYFDLGDMPGAISAVEKSLALDPTLSGVGSPEAARKLLARALLRTGQPEKAASELERVRQAGQDPETAWLLSRALLQEGRTAEAITLLNEAREFSDKLPPLEPDPSPFIGAKACAQCHSANYATQQSSRHAATYHPSWKGLKFLPPLEKPIVDPENPQVAHALADKDGNTQWQEFQDGEKPSTAILEFVFGSGSVGATPVGRDTDGQYREMRLSYYHKINGWDVTEGQPAQPADPGLYLGAILPPDGLRRCIGCHSTDLYSAQTRTGPAAQDHGIGCENCHGPGGNHLKAVELEFPDLAIARPTLASAREVTQLCARCHSPPGRLVRPSDPDAVRFQGTTLTWSRCYTQSNGGLSCVTCHNPHRDVEKSATYYESKCLECHAAGATATKALTAHQPSSQTACPVNPKGDCLSCHMPVARESFTHTSFTDHHIRVHAKAGGDLEP